MLEYTVTYSKLTYHRTTIKATSKEDILGKVAKLIFSQESSQPTELFKLDDQELEVQTEDVNISDVTFDEE
jgi:hypothetical protein